MRSLIVTAACLASSVALSEPLTWSTNGTTQTMTINPYPDFVITCGTGSVVVHTKDGRVEFRAREIYWPEYGRGWREAVENIKRVLEQQAPAIDCESGDAK